jgi:hypothetical protein
MLALPSIRSRSILAIVAPTLISTGLAGQTPISVEDVQQALAEHGVMLTASQLGPLPKVERKNPELHLLALQAQRIGPKELRLRLKCRNSGECLPFYAQVFWPSTEDMESALKALKATTTTKVEELKARPVMKIGCDATLLINGAHSEMSIPVIALQNGASGEKIRVTSHDHKQMYLAEVVDARILKMRLQ